MDSLYTSRQRGVAGDEADWRNPTFSTHSRREQLEALDEDALAEALPKKISLTDPNDGGSAYSADATNYLIDTGALRKSGCGGHPGALDC